MREKKTIHQEHEIGCGIACVAMLGGVTYEEARQILFPKSGVRLTSSGKLFTALKRFGRKPAGDRMISLKFIDFDHLTHVCLVGALLDKEKHWVVWDSAARKIRDPYRGDYQLRVVKYMPIK